MADWACRRHARSRLHGARGAMRAAPKPMHARSGHRAAGVRRRTMDSPITDGPGPSRRRALPKPRAEIRITPAPRHAVAVGVGFPAMNSNIVRFGVGRGRPGDLPESGSSARTSAGLTDGDISPPRPSPCHPRIQPEAGPIGDSVCRSGCRWGGVRGRSGCTESPSRRLDRLHRYRP
jgi:hypothetical protein